MVNKINIELVEELLKNAKITYEELAKKFKVSSVAILKRIKNLEKKKIILGYTAKVDWKKLGYVETYIGIDTEPEKYLEVAEELKRRKEVKEVYLTSGDHMILIKAVFENNEKLKKFVENLSKEKYIKKVCPAIIIEKML